MRPATRWIVQRPQVSGELRLFCFSHAGGSAVGFLEWQSLLDPRILVSAIQLPGRGARYHEAPYTNLAELVDAIAIQVAAMGNRPYAFFGHSLGALLAFEVARRLRQRRETQPLHLFVSGSHAPRRRATRSALHKLDDGALIARLRAYQGTPPELLAHRELMELILPTIRADFSLVENYAYEPHGQLLDIPMTVMAGERDVRDTVEQVEDWRLETSAGCTVRWFAGGHFFTQSCQRDVIAAINTDLEPYFAAEFVGSQRART